MRVFERIADGRLPVGIPSTIAAGYGSGRQTCCVCDLAILAQQVEYEIIDPRSLEAVRFHFGCFVAWQRECARSLSRA